MTTPVALITGAGGGIGRAAAIELALRRYRTVLCGRTPATLHQTATLLPATHSPNSSPNNLPNHLIITADVTQPNDITTLIEKTLTAFGRIDVLVNNAGIAPMLSIEQTSIQQFHAVLDTNLSAAFYLSKAVWPLFRRQGGGAIVNISSLAARDPFPGFAAYGSAKAGLNLLGLSLAREGATIGIRVYTIAPGAVETPLLRSLLTTEQIPTSQALSPADVAKVIGQCAAGDLQHTSGEVIWMHK
jgi:NAD(P)-dependent dehydrogenase (short-subunit alcohol dehydrogenase family)